MSNHAEYCVKEIVRANQLSKRLAGSIFKYSSNLNRLISNTGSLPNPAYIYRSLVLLLFSMGMLARISVLHFEKLPSLTEIFEVQLCTMMFFMCMGAAEVYRVRGTNPHELVLFLNQAGLFSSKSEVLTRVPKSGKSIKIVKLLFLVTRYSCTFILPISKALACTIKPDLPVNALWLLDYIPLSLLAQFPILFGIIAATKGLIYFATNFAFWGASCALGYRVLIKVTLGSFLLSSFEQVAYRYYISLKEKSI